MGKAGECPAPTAGRRSEAGADTAEARRADAAPQSVGDGLADAAPSVGGGATPPETSVTVVVADDDPGIRQVLEFVFVEEGFDVGLAHSAAEARRVAAGVSAGVVVVDLKLGRDDGLVLARELSREPHLAVVMVSAEPSLARRAAETGLSPDAVLTKPFPLDTLIDLVRRKADAVAARTGARPPTPDQSVG